MRGVLLDRDGTLNVERLDHEMELERNVGVGLRWMRRLGLRLVVVTNQSKMARGELSEEGLKERHERLAFLLEQERVTLDGIYVCRHAVDAGCDCRKPGIGMARRAAIELGLDLRKSFVIGDQRGDMEMGKRVGAVTILVRTGQGHKITERGISDHEVDDLLEAAMVIQQRLDYEEGQRQSGRDARMYYGCQ